MVADGGSRLFWTDLPPVVRREVERRMGAPVRRVQSMPGGFIPGMASAVDAGPGHRLFVKAISAGTTPQGPAIYRREAATSAALPPAAPAPRLLWSFELSGWVVLGFEHIPGRVPDVSREDDLDAVLRVFTRLASLDPAPIRARSFAEAFADRFGYWATLARDGVPPAITALGAWIPTAVPQLAEMEAPWAQVSAGTCLLHGDLRADNMLLTHTGDVVAVDWPEACIGAPWLDLVLALPSFAIHGVDPEAILHRHPLTRDLPAHALDALIAAAAGFFAGRSLLPPPPGLPTVRDFQHQQARAALRWLRARHPALATTPDHQLRG